ncbi:Ail/Lom family outer membrane beta-barrel protein, partial [Escherichia coli]|uniref:Ail/Lom family outer membrane beta-barrel protein n=1 Tax=Escherichia coli TaxID=562 RepID=UPI000ACD5677
MRKVCAAILSAAICLAVSGAPAWASEHQSTLSAGYLHASTNVPGSDDLNGINVKYRYEFTDTLGLVTSFSYAGDKNRQLTRYSDTRWHEDSVRNRWFSVMAGPSVRVNEWLSADATAGVACLLLTCHATYRYSCLPFFRSRSLAYDISVPLDTKSSFTSLE